MWNQLFISLKDIFRFFVGKKSHFSHKRNQFFLQRNFTYFYITRDYPYFSSVFLLLHIAMTITKNLIRGTVRHNCWRCHNVIFKGGWKLLMLMQYGVRRVKSSSQRWASSSWCNPSLLGETPPLGKINPFGIDPFTLP